MMQISIITGVIGLCALPAPAEKLTLACIFESGDSGRENQSNFDTDRPRVDLRVAQTMGPMDFAEPVQHLL